MNFWTPRPKPVSLLKHLPGLTAAVIAFGVNAQQPESVPLPFSADYSVKYGSVEVADVNLEFTTDNGLQLVTESKAKGLASLIKSGLQREVSSLQIKNGQLVGDSYSSTNISTRRAFRGKTRVTEERELEVKFDWGKSQASYLENGKKSIVALKPGSLDRQALPIKVRFELRKATATDPAARPPVLDYYFVDNEVLRHYKMEYQGDEKIDTKLGKLNTAKYLYGTEGDKKTVLWLAENKDWLPVRFDKIKPGKPALSMTIN
ncbi:MAG: hypothetical protein ACI91G_000194 [Gammaproteobacteria bacterium]|jgi:hypothetical protein